jgi:hypothetical protein
MMVANLGKTSRVGWGALLMLAQLLAFGILPTLHLLSGSHGGPAARVGASTDAAADVNARAVACLHERSGDDPSRTPGGHDHGTCQFCRVADARYTASPYVPVRIDLAAAVEGGAGIVPAWHGTPAPRRIPGPRAPPVV